ncbi:NAD(P)H-binding protein, partial [Mesorhizobium sp.]|uniref:NAD(P)H-binding protein n=1 Tax=Mesorhizobium sp. TaxID=1871066 RepID=UPI00122552C3
MNVAVVGATGLIGSAVCARLADQGHHVRGLVRRKDSKNFACAQIVVVDMSEASQAEWIGALEGIDAVVNCVGALQDGAAEDVSSVHVKGASTLFAACAASGIKRVIHFSAIGVERAQPSEFSATKLAGDEALMASEVDWVILRPSVVLGAPVFGASALIRGLAALPWLPSMPNTAALQPVQLEDVVSTVVYFLRDESPSRVVLDLPGPETFSMDELVTMHRTWMGWPAAVHFAIPPWLATWLYRL